MEKKGLLIVVSGFAGSGKGTLMKRLVEDYEGYALSVSMTTRNPRPGEVHGREYFFVSKEEFEQKIETGGLIEYASYVENGHRLDKHFVPGLYIENGLLARHADGSGGLIVGTKTHWVKGEFMAEKGKAAYHQAIARLLQKEIARLKE